jgi:hypothetical protein
MDYSDEDEEFTLTDPVYRAQESSKNPFQQPDLPPSWRQTMGTILLTTAVFIAALALGELMSRGITKWLDKS